MKTIFYLTVLFEGLKIEREQDQFDKLIRLVKVAQEIDPRPRPLKVVLKEQLGKNYEIKKKFELTSKTFLYKSNFAITEIKHLY